MFVDPTKEKGEELDYILKRLSAIKGDPHGGTDEKKIQKFLDCSYGRFKKCGEIFEPDNLKNNPSKFQDELEGFLNETENGSWSGLHRMKGYSKPRELWYDTTLELLRRRDSPKSVKDFLRLVTSPAGTQSGVSHFSLAVATAILFASDESNFMILDKPVLDFFGIGNDNEGIDSYDKIIKYSKERANKCTVDMWLVNKAYAIIRNNGYLVLKPLKKGLCLCSDEMEVVRIPPKTLDHNRHSDSDK